MVTNSLITQLSPISTVVSSLSNFLSWGSEPITAPGKILQFLPILVPSKIVTLATKQEIYDTLIAFGYKNKTLNYGYLMWGGFEFDSSLTEIPKLAKPYPEYKLISFNHLYSMKLIYIYNIFT